MPTQTRRKTSALQQLDELRQAVHAAEQHARETQAERASSARWLPAAQAKLADYLVAVDRGDTKPDPLVEQDLRDKVTDLEATRVLLEHSQLGDRYADRRAIARHEDAIAAIDEANSAVVAFVIDQREQIQYELADRAHAARDRLLAAIDELSAAAGAWTTTANDWRACIERWPDISPAEIPPHPLPGIARQDIEQVAAQIRGGAKDPRGALPMPVSLAPADGDQPTTIPLRGWSHIPRVISTEGGVLGA